MTIRDLVRYRLHNHGIVPRRHASPAQVAAWLGVVQAQEYAHAKWALGLRCHNASFAAVEQAIADRTVVRTWLVRGTLHLAAAADVRWMLALLAPRIIARGARRSRQLGLDAATLTRSYDVIDEVLQDGRPLTRAQVRASLEQAGLTVSGQRFYHILHRAALEGRICFGPMQGKQETLVLLDAWIPRGEVLERDAALAEMTRRYFRSHGPATLQDFVWWSGLTVTDARAGLAMPDVELHQVVFDGQSYWMVPDGDPAPVPSPTAHLLPAFDEYYVAYKDRDVLLEPQVDKRTVSDNGAFWPMIVVDGQVVGTWKQVSRQDAVGITLEPSRALTAAENQALAVAVERYGAYLDAPVELV